MSSRAFVFLQSLREQRLRCLGVVTVNRRPARGMQIQLEFRGKTEIGRVTSIKPTDWEGRPGVTPTIYVVQGEPS